MKKLFGTVATATAIYVIIMMQGSSVATSSNPTASTQMLEKHLTSAEISKREKLDAANSVRTPVGASILVNDLSKAVRKRKANTVILGGPASAKKNAAAVGEVGSKNNVPAVSGNRRKPQALIDASP